MRKLAAYSGKSPDLITEEELRAYFHYIPNDQLWEASSIRVAYSGIKFFYRHTCRRDWPTLDYLRVEDVLKLPTVLSIEETHQLLVHVRRGKGHKDRLVPLSPKPLELMRSHWST